MNPFIQVFVTLLGIALVTVLTGWIFSLVSKLPDDFDDPSDGVAV